MGVTMEKERINLFPGETKRLTDGRQMTTSTRIRRGGSAFFSTIALGVALFSVVFIIFCFSGGLGQPLGAFGGAGGEETTGEPGTSGTSGTIEEPSHTSPDGSTQPPGNNIVDNTGGDEEGGFLAMLKKLFEALGREAASVTTQNGTGSPVTEPLTPIYSDPDELYSFDYALVPVGHTAIVPRDMSLISYGEAYIYNDTRYSPKTSALLESSEAIPAFDFFNSAIYPIGNPVVLIVHTHGTEAYSEEGSISYSNDSELARSDDISKNVVAVGAVIADTLNSNGIKTLHSTIMHDLESYKDSYSRSAATINEYLAKHPSIQYVVDVHRDSLSTSTGSLIRPVTLVDGRAAAQVMCVVGSDYNGADCPNWQNNLALALKLRNLLNGRHTNICRPVYLRGSAYNQQYAPMSMLLEVGASGNSLAEAKEAAALTALALVDIIKGKAE